MERNYLMTLTTAAGIIIGDEILTGKIRDTNAPLLIDMLRAAGVALRRLVTIGDVPAMIAEEIRSASTSFDYVFTSGGLGPTHDDRTIEGIALAFGCRVVRHPKLETLVRYHWGERMNEAALRLAEVPEGARLLEGESFGLPTIVFRNIYILPGVPQLFSAKLPRVRQELSGTCVTLQSLYLSSDESAIAKVLGDVASEFEDVSIGSYPSLRNPEHKVRVTIESTNEDLVEKAKNRLLELLPPDEVIRVEK